MKKFEIAALGIEELTSQEQMNVDGGGIRDWILDYIVGKIADVLVDVVLESYTDGTQGEWYATMMSHNPYYCPLR